MIRAGCTQSLRLTELTTRRAPSVNWTASNGADLAILRGIFDARRPAVSSRAVRCSHAKAHALLTAFAELAAVDLLHE